jgi:hypothetical protein
MSHYDLRWTTTGTGMYSEYIELQICYQHKPDKQENGMVFENGEVVDDCWTLAFACAHRYWQYGWT